MKFFYVSVFVIWLYLQKAMYRPCDLDIWPMNVTMFLCIEYNPISSLYTFQINISSNSREIKYQNIDRTHRHRQTHTHRQTGWKQYLATPCGGEVITSLDVHCMSIRDWRDPWSTLYLWFWILIDHFWVKWLSCEYRINTSWIHPFTGGGGGAHVAWGRNKETPDAWWRLLVGEMIINTFPVQKQFN